MCVPKVTNQNRNRGGGFSLVFGFFLPFEEEKEEDDEENFLI